MVEYLLILSVKLSQLSRKLNNRLQIYYYFKKIILLYVTENLYIFGKYSKCYIS